MCARAGRITQERRARVYWTKVSTVTSALRAFLIELADVERPRQPYALRRETDLVVARLITEGAGERQRGQFLQRRLRLRRRVERDVLHDPERALEDRHVLVQRLEEVVFRR